MNYEPGTISIDLDIEIENDLEVDAEGNLFLLTILYPKSGTWPDKDPSECKCLFEDVITNLLEFYKDNDPHSNVGQLHSVAHELDRASERLREVAGYMESVRDGEHSDEDDSPKTEVSIEYV